MVDAVTNLPAVIWRGTDIVIDLGLFTSSTVILDVVAPIVTLYLEIHRRRSLPALLSKTVAAANIAITPTSETWLAGSAQNASIALTAAETQFDLAGDGAILDKADFWLVVHIVDNAGKKITWGVANLTVEEDAAQNDLDVVPMSNPNWRINDGELQLWNPTQSKYQTFYPLGTAGQETIAWGAGED